MYDNILYYSDALREALGLKPHQLPIHIYRMRVLGYPPGWMEEAKSDPGLSMFDKDGIGKCIILFSLHYFGYDHFPSLLR